MSHIFLLLASLSLIVSFGFYLRFMTRIKNRIYGDDNWGLLLWADYLRSKVKVSEFYKNFIPRVDFDYPLAVSKFLSNFSKRFCEKIEPVFSPLLDSINIALVFILTYLLTKSILSASVAALVYSTTPALIFNCTQLSARVAGYLLFLISALLGIYYIESANLYIFILAVLSGAVLVNTHKMATQVFVFWHIGMSLLEGEPALFLILIASFTFGLIISRGYYWKVLRGHLRNLGMHLEAIYSKDIGAYPTESLRSSYLKMCFWASLGFFAFYWNYPLSGYTRIAWEWFLITYGLFLLTSFIKPLRCMGQGYRYLEYGVAPLSFLLARPLAAGFTLAKIVPLGIIAVIFLLRIHRQNNLLYGYYTNIVDGARLQIYEFLKKQKDRRIFCLPSGMSMASAYFTRQRLLWMPGTEWKKLDWLFPYITIPPKIPFTEIIKRYNLDYLLLHTRFARPEALNLTNYSKVLEKGDYFLIEVGDDSK